MTCQLAQHASQLITETYLTLLPDLGPHRVRLLSPGPQAARSPRANKECQYYQFKNRLDIVAFQILKIDRLTLLLDWLDDKVSEHQHWRPIHLHHQGLLH
jgi:hypothetical protein